jgi:hypothetical protein
MRQRANKRAVEPIVVIIIIIIIIKFSGVNDLSVVVKFLAIYQSQISTSTFD